MDLVYLDNNATTRPAPEVVEAMLPYLTEWYGNASSLHRFGQRARQAIDEARGHVAQLVGCAESELLFTGGGTEAVNTAVRGIYAARSPRRRIVTTTVEHSATRELCAQMAKEGAEVVEIPVDVRGALDFDTLEAAVTDDTALVTIMWANNETGVLFEPERIAAVCKAKRVPFHCDGTQAIGKIPCDVAALGVDAMSFAAHKFHGPKGVGALFARRGLRYRPLLIGGPQERGRRGGTENVPAVVGMGKAAELARAALPNMSHVAARRDTLEQGICASAGAACASGSLEPSHVLKAMGIDPRVAHGAIRFSLSRYTTQAEVDRTLAVLPGVVSKLRAVLPVA